MKRLAIALAWLLLSSGCSGTTENNADLVQAPDTDLSSAGGDDIAAAPDVPVVDTGDTPPDTQPEDMGLEFFSTECEPGSGCFLDPCSANADCQSGFCVEHMGEAVCTKVCTEECPPGWGCKLVGESDPDVLYICVSGYSSLCKPCSISSDCKTFGGADDTCVDYGAEGSFCGGTCQFDSDCPWGFACKDVVSVDGVALNQCFAEAGVCPCTSNSVQKALHTPCEVSNEAGTCTGIRVCTEEGLTDCDAGIPALEVCNGLDDDCDGEVDEPTLVDGKYVEHCDDGNDCTVNSCAGEEGCVLENLSQGECVDDDACTIGDHCEAGVCGGLPIVCDDGNPCTDDLCDGVGGCTGDFNHVECDDGDPCTVADTCNQGVCVGYAVECNCLADEDCEALDDDDVCNGTLHCDTSQVPYVCVVAKETIVVCPEPQDGGSICVKGGCDPDTGACIEVSVNNGFACDDGDPCSIGDQCDDGECVPGVAANCDDGEVCTTDVCMPGSGCVNLDNTSVCNDGDVCTTNDVCADGDCMPGPALACADTNPCTADSCDSAVGCVHEAAEGGCDDGNACTEDDQCFNGICQAGAALDCNDGNECTTDSCSKFTGCTYLIEAGPCDDQDPCTLGDSCVNGACVSGLQVDCDDGNPCTADSCANTGACAHEPTPGDCDDSNPCTVGEKCSLGQCGGGQALYCDDDNGCTTDSCDPAGGCVHVLNNAPCDDGDVCTIGDHCQLGECISSSALSCNDSNGCTDDSCSADSGCEFVPNTMACDDGNNCTQNDECQGGICVGGEPPDCDDDNQCTDDVCVAGAGCMHFNNNDPCNDQDACTANEVCFAGKCGGGGPIQCDDDNVCTDDECNPASGCVFTANSAPCTDDDACTSGDQCSDGECFSGEPTDCDDSNPCTIDQCDSEGGCYHEAVADETGCGEDLWCEAGQCVSVMACDAAVGNKKSFTTSGSWEIPGDVKKIRVMVVGGGGGGAKGHGNGAGSGHVRKAEFDVTPCEVIQVSIGGGGSYDQAGSSTSFGALKSASGGSPGLQNSSGSGAGGSGGGGAGNAGCGGNGGTGGSSGQSGCTYGGGAGGNFDDVVSGYFQHATMSHGAGGGKGSSSHAGGGGGGGIYIDGAGPGGGNGAQSWSGKGGKGYGGGGGGGGYQSGNYANGGTGGKGVVYVEWD
jgi:hypothetical protein